MAEVVQLKLERMVPELRDLEDQGLFSAGEVRQIVRKRTNHEYAVVGRHAGPADFLRYIHYELSVDALRRLRKGKMRGRVSKSERSRRRVSDGACQQRVHALYQTLLRKRRTLIPVWKQYFAFCIKTRSRSQLSRAFAESVRFNPLCADLWILAAAWEEHENHNTASARVLLERGLRFNAESAVLWLKLFELELAFAQKVLRRFDVLGIPVEKVTPATMAELVEASTGVASGAGVDVDALPQPVTDDDGDDDAGGRSSNPLDQPNFRKFLGGSAARIVFDGAMQKMQSPLALQMRFLSVARRFSNATALAEYIRHEVVRAHGDEPEAWDTLARTEKSSAHAEATYREGLGRLPGSGDLWQRFVAYFFERAARASLSAPESVAMADKVIEVATEAAQDGARLSGPLVAHWVDAHLALGQADKALRAAKVGVTNVPDSPDVWVRHLRLSWTRLAGSAGETTLQRALDAVPREQRMPIVICQLQLLATHAPDALVDHMRDLVNSTTALELADREDLAIIMLKHILMLEGTAEFHAATKRTLRVQGWSAELTRSLLHMELALVPRDIKRCRHLYRRLLQDDTAGQQSATWLEACRIELLEGGGGFATVAELYAAARRELNKTELARFSDAYQGLFAGQP